MIIISYSVDGSDVCSRSWRCVPIFEFLVVGLVGCVGNVSVFCVGVCWLKMMNMETEKSSVMSTSRVRFLAVLPNRFMVLLPLS